jgi:hypothetical protein
LGHRPSAWELVLAAGEAWLGHGVGPGHGHAVFGKNSALSLHSGPGLPSQARFVLVVGMSIGVRYK